MLAALGHMGVSGLVHVAQNQLAKKFLTSKAQTSLYRNMFHHGMKGVNPHFGISSARGLKTSLVPEIGMASQMSQQFGSNFAKHLKNTPIKSYGSLSAAQKRFLQNLAGGDFNKVAVDVNNPMFKPLFDSYMRGLKDSSNKAEIKNMVDRIYTSFNPSSPQGITNLGELSKQYKKSRVSKIMPELFRDLSSKETKVLGKASMKGRGLAHLPSEVLGNAMIYKGDPTAAGFNVLKRFIASPTVEKIPVLNKIQDSVYKHMMVDPIKKSWNQGMRGVYKEPTKVKTFVQRDLVNPVRDDLSRLVGNIGNTLHKAQQPEKVITKSFIPRSLLPKVRKPKSF